VAPTASQATRRVRHETRKLRRLEFFSVEPPVPAGLGELSGPLHALIEFLTDLHDLAVWRGQTAEFQTALEKIRQVHAAKGSFLRRLAMANL
jgi:hypothetical protein